MQNVSNDKNTSSNVTSLSKKRPAISLKQILRGDKDVRDFYKMIDQYGFRERAVSLLQARIDKNN